MALETTAELLTQMQVEVGDDNPTAATTARHLALLDRAHKTIVGGGGEFNVDDSGNLVRSPCIFPWAISQNPIVQNTEAPISTGTIAATQSSTSVTFSVAPSASSVAGYFIRINNADQVYRIATHTGGATAATLDAGFVEDDVTASTFELFKIDYTFGSTSILIPVSPLIIHDGSAVYGVSISDIDELRNQYPLADIASGVPRLAGVAIQGDGDVTLRLNSYPENIERMELNYVALPTTLASGVTDPIIPKHYRVILVHAAAFYEMRAREDDRAQSQLRSAQELFKALKTEAAQVNYGGDKLFGRISPFSGGFKPLRLRRSNFGRPNPD